MIIWNFNNPITLFASCIWNFSEWSGIGLGKLAPLVFGLVTQTKGKIK